jgi:hypothetical protein
VAAAERELVEGDAELELDAGREEMAGGGVSEELEPAHIGGCAIARRA